MMAKHSRSPTKASTRFYAEPGVVSAPLVWTPDRQHLGPSLSAAPKALTASAGQVATPATRNTQIDVSSTNDVSGERIRSLAAVTPASGATRFYHGSVRQQHVMITEPKLAA